MLNAILNRFSFVPDTKKRITREQKAINLIVTHGLQNTYWGEIIINRASNEQNFSAADILLGWTNSRCAVGERYSILYGSHHYDVPFMQQIRGIRFPKALEKNDYLKAAKLLVKIHSRY